VMKKISLFAMALAVMLVLAACGDSDGDDSSSDDSDGDVITWKLGHLADENHIWHDTSLKFAELVEEKTDGQIEIKVYPSNTLGGETDTINAINAGTADMVISGETLENWAPKAALLATPYAFRDLDHVQKVVEGEIGDEIEEEIIEKAELTPLFYMTRDTRNLSSNKRIESVEDIKDFKIRDPKETI